MEEKFNYVRVSFRNPAPGDAEITATKVYPVGKDGEDLLMVMAVEVSTGDLPMTHFYLDVEVGEHLLNTEQWQRLMMTLAISYGSHIATWRNAFEIAIAKMKGFDFTVDDLEIQFGVVAEGQNLSSLKLIGTPIICVRKKGRTAPAGEWIVDLNLDENDPDKIVEAMARVLNEE